MRNKDTKIMKIGDDVMINVPKYDKKYIKSKFLKNGEDVKKVDIRKHHFGKNNLRCDSDGRWTIDIKSGKIIKIEGDKYLIGFDELYDWGNKLTYVNGNPSTFKTPHDYYPSFPRTNKDGEVIEYDICEYGCWIDRNDFYLLGGFEHLNRLISESVKEMEGCESTISRKKDWIVELEDKLQELETTQVIPSNG